MDMDGQVLYTAVLRMSHDCILGNDSLLLFGSYKIAQFIVLVMQQSLPVLLVTGCDNIQ